MDSATSAANAQRCGNKKGNKMKSISRRQLLKLADLYFAGEQLDVLCGEQVSLEEAYQNLRDAVSGQHAATVPSEELHFTSEPQDGELDMSKLKYK